MLIRRVALDIDQVASGADLFIAHVAKSVSLSVNPDKELVAAKIVVFSHALAQIVVA